MAKTRKVTIEFNCVENMDAKLFCEKCSHNVIDFRNKTSRELNEEIKRSQVPVCGIFKKSQLSDQFLKYAAATFIATSLTMPTFAQEVIKGESLLTAFDKMNAADEEHVFLGIVIETQAEPVGGYKKFLESIESVLNYPSGLSLKGRTFVEFTVDTLGKMKDVKVVKGFNDLADTEAVRALTALNYPFTPGKQRGKPVKTRLIFPIVFDPEKKRDKK
jgi:hypothetical protein